jgi:hypothetical protein
VIHAWRLAQEHWEKGDLIPGHIYVCLVGHFEMLQCHLASLHETKDPKSPKIRTPIEHISNTSEHIRTHSNIVEQAYVYVRGSCEYLSWGQEIRRKRVLAGQESARKRALLYGSAQPKSNTSRTRLEHVPTNVNILELSSSSSGSDSSSRSGSKDLNLIGLSQIESLYALYPQRHGTQRKTQGMEILKKKLVTPEHFSNMQKAIANYKAHCDAEKKTGTEFVSQFKTFVGSIWEEWIEPPKQLPVVGNGNGIHKKTADQIRKEANDAFFTKAAEQISNEESAKKGEIQ